MYGTEATVLFFLASDSPLQIEYEIGRSGRPLQDEPLHYSYMGFNSVEDFVVALRMDEEGVRDFARGAPLSTDDRNLMATRSRSRGDGLRPEELTALFEPHDPLLDGSSWIHRDFRDVLNFAYIASRLLAEQRVSHVIRLTELIPDRTTQALISALGYEYNGDTERMNQALQISLESDPDNQQSRFKMLASDLPSFALGQVSEEAAESAALLTGVPAAVIEGWPLGAEQNWSALAEMDSRLSEGLITDIWYPATVKLRADWRTKVVGQGRYAYEGLRLVDRALVIRPELDLYVLRAAAAAALNDHAAFIESGRYVASYLNGKLERTRQESYTMSDIELVTIIRRLTAFNSQLGQITRAATRGQEVQDSIADLLRDYTDLRNERPVR